MKYPTPTEPGYYWAKLVHPSGKLDLVNYPNQTLEDMKSVDWEVVEVYDNNSDDDERLGVFVFGIQSTQWAQDFIWGPKVDRPKELI